MKIVSLLHADYDTVGAVVSGAAGVGAGCPITVGAAVDLTVGVVVLDKALTVTIVGFST